MTAGTMRVWEVDFLYPTKVGGEFLTISDFRQNESDNHPQKKSVDTDISIWSEIGSPRTFTNRF